MGVLYYSEPPNYSEPPKTACLFASSRVYGFRQSFSCSLGSTSSDDPQVFLFFVLLLVFHVLLAFMAFRLSAGCTHRLHERGRACRRPHISKQDLAKGDVFAVDGLCGIIVLLYDCAFQGESSKSSFGTRIGEHFGVQFPVCSCGGMSTHRPRCGGSFAANLELAGKQMLQAIIIHDQHY